MSQNDASLAATGSLKEVLRARKRAQKPASCEPCRERKVRCDKGHPCATCDKRGYPDLCVYLTAEPGRRRSTLNSRRNTSTASPAPGGCVINANAATPAPGPEPHYTPASLAGGGGIIGSQLSGTTTPTPTYDTSPTNDTSAHRTAFSLGILPLLGAGSETSGSVTEGAWRGTLAQLSAEHGALDLFLWYRRQVHPFYAIPLDVDDIEKKFCLLLNLCDSSGGGTGPEPARDPNWLCLLNAILAAGAQASEMPLERRLSMSRLHTRLAFQGLHATDYLSKPYKEAIQALLLLGNILQNDMKPQAAWALWGSTMRLAQCLGIHMRQSHATSTSVSSQDAAYLRLAIVWQDSLLSLAFGRMTECNEMDFEEDLPSLHGDENSDGFSYRGAMNWLCHIATRHLGGHPSTTPSLSPLSCCQDIGSLDTFLSPHLRDRQSCRTIQDIQEHYAFELHKNFSVSTICRPYISERDAARVSSADRAQILTRLQEALKRSAEAYLHLRSVSGYARRSWAFIHNGLASILLLSLMKESRDSENTRRLQGQIIDSLEQDSSFCSDASSEHTNRLSDTHRKALKALKALKRLSEGESTEERVQSVAAAGNNIPTEAPDQGQNNQMQPVQAPDLTFVPPEDWEVDEWLSAFDFDQSPLGAFESIMADPSTGYQI